MTYCKIIIILLYQYSKIANNLKLEKYITYILVKKSYLCNESALQRLKHVTKKLKRDYGRL